MWAALKRLTNKSTTPIVISLLLSAFSFFLLTIFRVSLADFLELKDYEAHALSIALTFFILYFGTFVTFYMKQDELKAEISHLLGGVNAAVKNQVDAQVFENTKEAFLYLMRELPFAEEVKNTTIRVGPGGYYDRDFFTSEEKLGITNCFKSILERRRYWRDVISDNLKGHEDERKRIADKIQDGAKTYKYWKVSASEGIPFTNFIIIRYGKDGYELERQTEVLFGWAYNNDDATPYVILSRNPNVVTYFEKQFETLVRCAIASGEKGSGND